MQLFLINKFQSVARPESHVALGHLTWSRKFNVLPGKSCNWGCSFFLLFLECCRALSADMILLIPSSSLQSVWCTLQSLLSPGFLNGLEGLTALQLCTNISRNHSKHKMSNLVGNRQGCPHSAFICTA